MRRFSDVYLGKHQSKFGRATEKTCRRTSCFRGCFNSHIQKKENSFDFYLISTSRVSKELCKHCFQARGFSQLSLKEQCNEANNLKMIAIFVQFRWSTIRVNRPHAFPSISICGTPSLLDDYFQHSFGLKTVSRA